ncbi:RNA polymerase subunit AC19 [Gnomoniopsis sp. IMI 355080]|nr:RNA polymerase subunit AC19 [Gnomoniopsis sp. IMI 355080]
MSQNGEDTFMEDAQGSQTGETEVADEVSLEKKLFLLPGSTATAASFEFRDENHTLGNALRYIIMKNPDVEFCAYAMPHPSEPKMNMRIQTYEETTAIDALKKGLRDLQELCDVVAEKFWDARETKTPAPSTKQLQPNGEPRMLD